MVTYTFSNIDILSNKARKESNPEPWTAKQLAMQILEDSNTQVSYKTIKKSRYYILQFLFLQKRYSEVSHQGTLFLENPELGFLEKGNIHHLISRAFHYSSSYKQAIKHGKKAIIYFRQCDNMEGLAKAHTALAAAYRKKHKYYKTIQHLKLSLDIKKSSGSFSKTAISLTLKHLADFYCFLKEYNKALIYYKLAAKTQKEEPNCFRSAGILNRLGFVYRKLERFELSWKYTLKAYRISYKKNYRNILFQSYTNLAHLYYKKGLYRKSIKSINKARNLVEKTTLTEKASVGVFILLSQSYLKINQEEKALQIALTGLRMNSNLQKEREILLYESIIKYYYWQQDFPKLYFYQKLKEKSISESWQNHMIFERNKNKYKQKEFLAKKEQLLLKTHKRERKIIRQKAEESKKYLDEFVNIFIHDAKAPIRHIQGFSNLLAKKLKVDNPYSEYLEMINASSKELSTIVDDLYTYAATGANSKPMNFIQLDPIIGDIQIILRKIILKHQLKITLNINHKIYSEKNLLIQLFQHLIQNAIKYTKPGVLPEITISSQATKDDIILTCSDNGIGIDEFDQKIIFLPFSKTSHASKQKKDVGMGIELATCLKIMKKHNGQILVESEIGKGTNFKMYFPIPK